MLFWVSNFLCEFCLMILFLFNMIKWFIVIMVDKWWVIVIIVLFFIKCVRFFWIVIFILEFKVLVVLFNKRIGVFLSIMCVIVICWCCFFESFIFCFFMWVLKFVLFLVFWRFGINLFVVVCLMVLSIFFFVVFGLLYIKFLCIEWCNNEVFWVIKLICECKFFCVMLWIFWLLMVIELFWIL